MTSEGIGVEIVERESIKRTATREAKKGKRDALKKMEIEKVKRDEKYVRKQMEIRTGQAKEDWLEVRQKFMKMKEKMTRNCNSEKDRNELRREVERMKKENDAVYKRKRTSQGED